MQRVTSSNDIPLSTMIEIINGYTVTFQDGQYRVRFVGSNNNISDVANLNQVSLLPRGNSCIPPEKENSDG